MKIFTAHCPSSQGQRGCLYHGMPSTFQKNESNFIQMPTGYLHQLLMSMKSKKINVIMMNSFCKTMTTPPAPVWANVCVSIYSIYLLILVEKNLKQERLLTWATWRRMQCRGREGEAPPCTAGAHSCGWYMCLAHERHEGPDTECAWGSLWCDRIQGDLYFLLFICLYCLNSIQ